MNQQQNFAVRTLVVGTTVAAGLTLSWLAYKYFFSKKLGKRAVVKSLFIYPVKSCAGIALDQIEITKIGVLLDRSWALFNSKGSVQTMRQLPMMALIKPSFEGTKYLCLDAPGMPTLKLDVDLNENDVEAKMLDVFGLHGEGLDCGDEAAKWFDKYLGKPGHRLFNGCSKSLKRRELREDPDWGDLVKENDKIIYHDDAPVLLTSERSLEAVNKELPYPLDIRTFRPNIYVEGSFSFEEDLWRSVQIGEVLLRYSRQSSRCVLTTVDMDSGVRRADSEPFKTLKRMRVSSKDDPRYRKKPLFGILMVADKPGVIRVGDDVTFSLVTKFPFKNANFFSPPLRTRKTPTLPSKGIPPVPQKNSPLGSHLYCNSSRSFVPFHSFHRILYISNHQRGTTVQRNIYLVIFIKTSMHDAKSLLVLGSSVVLGIGLFWFAYTSYRRKKLGKRGVVKSLHVYPVKSCAGVKLNQVEIEEVGPFLDRAWLLTNAKGIYQNLISIPKLALVQPSFEDGKYLCLDAPGMETLKLDIHMEDDIKKKKSLQLYTLAGEGLDCGDEAAQWFDTFLGKTGLRLYNGQNRNLKRRELKDDPVWQDAAKDGDKMIFSNFAPVLLTCEESLTALNKNLGDNAVDMRSFRPSIVVQGCDAFEEDMWHTVKIGNVILRKFRNSARCPLTTVDPDAGSMRKSGEPLKTLKRTHAAVANVKNMDKRQTNKPLFGVLCVPERTGTITVGDEVIILA
ncbi:uncharacterized protein LOC114532352 [Dendronephthya gigantea]|uniref:uncharacterized protein LOC114532352 n=1 Tax=Dendronephthya gigantea TaxID=151771 RepID=UPI00106BA15D|nr:uncharacterized protein LOC114532352 [Dendronephthya gigantea]